MESIPAEKKNVKKLTSSLIKENKIKEIVPVALNNVVVKDTHIITCI